MIDPIALAALGAVEAKTGVILAFDSGGSCVAA